MSKSRSIHTRDPSDLSLLITATSKYLRGVWWYSSRSIGILDGKWREVKDLYDRVNGGIVWLEGKIDLYDTITKGVSIREKELLDGEILLLELAINSIYNDSDKGAGNVNGLKADLIRYMSLVSIQDDSMFSLESYEQLQENIRQLHELKGRVGEDKELEAQFLSISDKIISHLRIFTKNVKAAISE